MIGSILTTVVSTVLPEVIKGVVKSEPRYGEAAEATVRTVTQEAVKRIEQALPPSKRWYQSRAIWGGALGILAGVAELYGVAFSERDAVFLQEAVPGILASVGGILAIIGRVRATSNIKL